MPNPSFIIIGASRSGTSSLYYYLKQNPEIYMPTEKEVHFFDFKYGHGLEWYRKKFIDGAICGEASPFYLPLPSVANRVRKDLPGVKIIALCREPGQRAYSHYQFNIKRSEDTKPFLQACRAEKTRLKNIHPNSERWRRFSYLARGRYAEQLVRWVDFDIRVVRSEDLFTNPHTVVSSLCSWLGAKPHEFKTGIQRKQSYPQMGKQARQWLDSYFDPFNKQLKDDWGIEWNNGLG